jgi:hypothetical protein
MIPFVKTIKNKKNRENELLKETPKGPQFGQKERPKSYKN